MGVRLFGNTAITLTPVGAARFRFVKFPLGSGPVAFVEISWAIMHVGSHGREPERVMRNPFW